jgi:MFS family permease
VYDLPASLSEPLRSHLSLDESQYAYLISLLYTVYSAPNTILPFFSGALTQRFGERQVWCTTGACLVVGQLACAFGVQLRQVWLIILGRVVIGLGAEIIGVLGYDVVTRWYSYVSAPISSLSSES